MRHRKNQTVLSRSTSALRVRSPFRSGPEVDRRRDERDTYQNAERNLQGSPAHAGEDRRDYERENGHDPEGPTQESSQRPHGARPSASLRSVYGRVTGSSLRCLASGTYLVQVVRVALRRVCSEADGISICHPAHSLFPCCRVNRPATKEPVSGTPQLLARAARPRDWTMSLKSCGRLEDRMASL